MNESPRTSPLDLLEMKSLYYFVTVAESLDYRRAARRLHVSESSLGEKIKQLEQLLETQLLETQLERDTARVRLTPAGETALREARQLFAQERAMVESARRAARRETSRLSPAHV